MDLAHLHLMLNHFPIIGSLLALPLLGIAAWRPLERSALIGAVVVLGISAIGAAGADFTGEPAEELVEELPGVSEHWIHEHEERAEVAVVLSVVNGLAALALLGWAYKKGRTPALGVAGLLALTAGTSGDMAWTGLAGGQIHHPELRREALPLSDGGGALKRDEALKGDEVGEWGDAGDRGEAEKRHEAAAGAVTAPGER